MYPTGNRSSQATQNSNAYLAGGALLCLGLFFWNQTGGDKTGVSYLYLLGVIQASPLVLSLLKGRVTYIDFILVNHMTVFTVSRLNVFYNLGSAKELPEDVMLAIHVLIISTSLMYASHWLTRKLFFRSFFQENTYDAVSLSQGRQLLILAVVVAFPFTLNFIPGPIIIPIFSGVSALFVLLFVTQYEGSRSREIWFKSALFMSALHHFVVTGFMTLLGQFAAIAFLTVCLKRGLRGSLFILPIAFLLSVVQSVKGDYRALLAQRSDLSGVEGFGLVLDLIQDRYIGDADRDEDQKTKDIAQGFARVGDNSLELVLAQTPSLVPFWNGTTYETIPFMFIPRFLWPDKPSRSFWNQFGHLYGVLSEDDETTSVGVGFLAEAYMNYGFAGVYVLSLLFGVFVAALERFAATVFGRRTHLAFLVFLMPVMGYANDLGTMLSSLFVAYGVLVFLTVAVGTPRKDAYGIAD